MSQRGVSPLKGASYLEALLGPKGGRAQGCCTRGHWEEKNFWNGTRQPVYLAEPGGKVGFTRGEEVQGTVF